MWTCAKKLKRAPQMAHVLQIHCYLQSICICGPQAPFFPFFSTFLVGSVCTTCRGWRRHGLQWGDATVHAQDTSRELSLWPSLRKLLSTGVAHFSWHGATADPTAVSPLCDLDFFCVWTLHGNAWPPPLTYMIFWCAWLWLLLLCDHVSVGSKAEERTQATCTSKTSVVVSQTKPSKAQQTDAASLALQAGSTPFKGSTVIEEHTSCNGECTQCRIGTLEVFLHEAEQENRRVLWTMWTALDKGAECMERRSVESVESMGGMGESPKDQQQRIVFEAKECFKAQEKQRRERSRQRWIQEGKRPKFWTAICTAISVFELPICTNIWYTMGWGCNFLGDISFPGGAIIECGAGNYEQRIGGCAQQSLCFKGANAIRGERVDRQGQSAELEKYHKRASHRNLKFRQSKEGIGRNSRISTSTSASMDTTSTGLNCNVEQTVAGVHGTSGNVVGTRRTSNARNPSCYPGNSGIEQQGSRRIRKSLHADYAGNPGEQRGRTQTGSGGRRAQGAATQSTHLMCKSCWSRRVQPRRQGGGSLGGFRQRRPTSLQKTKVYRRKKYFVTSGRIVSCLKVNGRCKGHRKVCFDVVEAYDMGNRAAGLVLAFIPLPPFESTKEYNTVMRMDDDFGKVKTVHDIYAYRHDAPTSQWRPNADIVLNFDDDLPFSSSSDDGQRFRSRYIPPPGWQTRVEYIRARQDRALYTDEGDHLQIQITSWLVDHGRPQMHQGSRSLTIRPQVLPLLNQRLRHLWRDQVRRRDLTSYVIVTPTPATIEEEDRTIHVIVEKNRPQHTEWQPVLLTLRAIEQGVPQNADRRAVLVQQVITREGLCQNLNIGCNPVHMMVPSGRRQGWLQAHEERVVTAGQHIPIWWDLRRRIETPQEEEVSLFQLVSNVHPLWQARRTDVADESPVHLGCNFQPDEPGRWPRPLRSASQPWGLPDLSCRELRQLQMGTRLYLHSLVAELLVYSGGGSTLKEHPKAPEDRQKVTTWDLHASRCWVAKLHKAWHSHVAQWRFGSVAVKPTTLRHLGCPDGHRVLRSFELPNVQYPSEKLEGKDETWSAARHMSTVLFVLRRQRNTQVS